MSHIKKISIVVLGREESLKKALITSILANDLKHKTKVLKISAEIYENDIFRIFCISGLYSESDDIRDLYAINPYPDMSLLVVNEGFVPEDVWTQIEKLHTTTGKPTEEFTVVLPLSYKQPESYMFRHCTIDRLFSELTRLAEDRGLLPAAMRHPGHPESTSHTEMDTTGNVAATRVNLVLLGMAGTGKSASGNTILGEQFFTSRVSSDLITKECNAADAVVCGRHVRVIDTPDIFDDDIPLQTKAQHVRKCKELCEQQPCVFLLVMHISRFTDGEKNILQKLERAFGNRVHGKTLILFTRVDDLKRGEISKEEFLDKANRKLKKIVEQCGNRCVLFENKAAQSHQVERLMQTVDEMLK